MFQVREERFVRVASLGDLSGTRSLNHFEGVPSVFWLEGMETESGWGLLGLYQLEGFLHGLCY